MQDKKDSWLKRTFDRGRYAVKRFWQWLKRAFIGKRLEEIPVHADSPTKMLKEAFFRKRGVVVALIFLVCNFLFMFIAPAFMPMDTFYTDPLQQNAAPNYSMLSAPKQLRNNVRDINGFSDFTVGLSSDNQAFVWGNTKQRLSGKNLQKIPETIKRQGASFIAAGKDHILALSCDGQLIGWGDKSCGQYGFEQVGGAISCPAFLAEGISPDRVSALACGYQVSSLLQTDGEAFLWGNTNTVQNLAQLSRVSNVKKVVFTNALAVLLLRDGTLTTGSSLAFTSAVKGNGERVGLLEYLADKKVLDIAATNKCVAIVLENGETLVTGVMENGEENIPGLQSGEYFTAVSGGTRHFVGVTNAGNAYAWGHNAYRQCNVVQNGRTASVYTGALQTYTADKDGHMIQRVGLKGYIMGTDGRGRDVFLRIVHGGKMTLTIGAVAVLVSSTIAVLVGAISGYFGGWIDTLLMRITEIFSSIPFLPFAMLLSQIVKRYDVSENMRIFLIMLILGALSWTGLARMIRGQILAEREKEYALAARAMGVKEGKIAFRHVLPNVISVILVSMTLDFAGCLLTESSLSYLGFGVQQPSPTWGNMLQGSNNSIIIQNYWWQWLFPALFLSLTTICINIVGDSLRDALDPKSEEK